jgi:hypothetical protein
MIGAFTVHALLHIRHSSARVSLTRRRSPSAATCFDFCMKLGAEVCDLVRFPLPELPHPHLSRWVVVRLEGEGLGWGQKREGSVETGKGLAKVFIGKMHLANVIIPHRCDLEQCSTHPKHDGRWKGEGLESTCPGGCGRTCGGRVSAALRKPGCQ